MGSQSCLDGVDLPVAADTSVVINVIATGHAESILDALPNRVLVVSQVGTELDYGQSKGRTNSLAFNALSDSGRVTIVGLDPRATGTYMDLVSGTAAQTLGDGEAATIAYALTHKAIALIDERKANRICSQRFPELPTASTIDLLSHQDVQAKLRHDTLIEAVFNALHLGRMRVSPHHLTWVVDLIGPNRARQCPSLPASVRHA